MYKEEDYLMISGIQHFVFCRRQWALIHVENQWQENILTYEGEALHERTHNPLIREKRKGSLSVRSLRVHSPIIGLTGQCDVVEFMESKNGIKLNGKKGTYQPNAVEYKKGHKKYDQSDVFQLLGETLCLENMLNCDIDYGYLFYFETKQRIRIQFNSDMRMELLKIIEEMHNYWARKYTPKVKPKPKCKKCSMLDICMPSLYDDQLDDDYIRKRLAEQ